MKVAVIGSHTFADYKKLKSELQKHPISKIIVSRNSWISKLLEWYAIENDVPYQHFDTEASFFEELVSKQNCQIIDACDLVIAFWDGKSRKTMKAIQYAKKKNKAIEVKKI